MLDSYEREGRPHEECLATLEDVKSMFLKSCSYVQPKEDTDADVKMFQSCLEAAVSYQVTAIREAIDGLGQVIATMNAREDAPEALHSFDKLFKELTARATALVPPALTPRWEPMRRRYDTLLQIITYRLRFMWKCVREVRELDPESTPADLAEEAFAKLVNAMDLQRQNLEGLTDDLDKATVDVAAVAVCVGMTPPSAPTCAHVMPKHW